MPTIAQLSVVDRINLDLRNQLRLSFLSQTDNPNVKIEFTDPSPDAKGVQLGVDGGEMKAITSPHTIETLKIGPHELVFKFTDVNGLEQELTEELLIYPRQPVIEKNTEQVDPSTVKIKGSSLGNSTIELLIHTPNEVMKGVANADESGNWVYELKYEFVSGAYSVLAVTNYEGYRSSLSEPLTFKVETSEGENIAPVVSNTVVAPRLSLSYFRENPNMALTLGGILLAGIVLGIIVNNVLFYKRKKFFETLFQSAIRSDNRDRKLRIPADQEESPKKKKQKNEDLEAEITVKEKPINKLKMMQKESSLRHMDFARGETLPEVTEEEVVVEEDIAVEEFEPTEVVEESAPAKGNNMLNKISLLPVSKRKQATSQILDEYLTAAPKKKATKKVSKAADRTKRGSIKIDMR